MKSIQLIKQVNNTEVGTGSTHETYILIPRDLEVSDLFEENNREYTFTDKDTSKEFSIRLTSGREKRIVGMGPYYREKKVVAGDRIYLEKRIFENEPPQYYISVQRTENVIYFQKIKGHFEVLTPKKIQFAEDKVFSDEVGNSVEVRYFGKVQKRNDSASHTNVYDIFENGVDIGSKYGNKEIIGFKHSDKTIKIIKPEPWEKYIIEVKR